MQKLTVPGEGGHVLSGGGGRRLALIGLTASSSSWLAALHALVTVQRLDNGI